MHHTKRTTNSCSAHSEGMERSLELSLPPPPVEEPVCDTMAPISATPPPEVRPEERATLRRISNASDDALLNLEMKIMNMRTGRNHEVNFFIDPVEFLSVKTAENVHTYLWVLKDLSWTQNWYWSGLIVGALAMALSSLVCIGSLHSREYAAAWHNFAQLMWLVSNFIWMTGDFHDARFPNAPSVYDERSEICRGVMVFALAWLGVYYLVLRPCNVFNEKVDPYCRITNKSWVSKFIFKNWR